MKRDLVVGATSGYTFSQIRYWINSLDRSGFTGERVVFVGNGSAPLVDDIRACGCQVVLSPAAPPFSDGDARVERYRWLWEYLSTRAVDDIRYVISVDMRDAIFQSDPSAWMVEHLDGNKLVVSSEGLTYADQPWNRESMSAAFGASVFGHMRDRLVWNGGTLAGEVAPLRDLALNLYLCSKRLYSDQASLNLLLSLWPYRELTLFDEGNAGWACHASTMSKSARGPELSYKFRGLEPLFDGDRVYTSTGTPFCIVHQYDRVPAWKTSLEKKFG